MNKSCKSVLPEDRVNKFHVRLWNSTKKTLAIMGTNSSYKAMYDIVEYAKEGTDDFTVLVTTGFASHS